MNVKVGSAGCFSWIKSKNYAFLLLSFTIILLSLPHFSGAQNYRSTRISLAQGLSQSSVYSITQDFPGFIWVATQDGLNKYDGNSFETFYNQPFDSSSLPSGNIMSVFCDSKNRLWVGTASSGLSLYNRSVNSFHTFSESDDKGAINDNSIISINENNDGTLWIATSMGLNRLIESKNVDGIDSLSFESINVGNDSLLRNITMIFPEKNGVIWVGTRKGLFKVITVSNGIQQNNSIKAFTKESGLTDNFICNVFRDKKGRLIVITKTGVSVSGADGNTFRSFQFTNRTGKNVYVNCATLFSDQSVWLGCDNGVYRFDTNGIPEINGSGVLIERINPENDFTKGTFISITEDKINKGIAWAGSEVNGITKIVPVTKNFYSDDFRSLQIVPFVYSLLKDSSYLWIGTTSGLIRRNLNSKKDQLLTIAKAVDVGWSADYIYHLKKDTDGNLFVGTMAGLYLLKKPYAANPEFTRIVVNKDFPNIAIRDLYTAGKDLLYVAMLRKVFLLNTKTLESKMLLALDNLEIEKKVVISSLAIDSNDNFFVGTSQGLLLFTETNGKYNFSGPTVIRHIATDTTSLRCENIYNLTVDSDNSLWLATANGLSNVKFNSKNHFEIKNYSRKNGLRNNAVYTILEDKRGNSIWFSTNGGLTKFDKSTHRFFNYDLHDGLQSNEFNAGAGCISDNNEIFFGGVNGFTSFYPWEIKVDTVKPQLAITNFQILGKERSQLSDDVNKIELKYYDNSFSIEFVALQYANPAKNQYAYMLEGYQKEWTNLGTTNKVIFSNLPPGEFVFRVIGSNEDGVFNQIGERLIICIRPPFYKTIWFYLSLVLVVGSMLWLLHAYRLKFKMNQLAAIEKIRTDTAADFHDELGHKLTTISWFSEIMKRKLNPDQKELKGYLDKITGTTGALYHTMHDLLWAMDPDKDSLFDLYKQLREFGESLFDQTEFRFISMEDNPAFKNDTIPFEQKRHVLLIFKEVMNNSFKHSKATTVSLNALRENNHYTLIVKDDGSGITADAGSYGNGLKNVYKRSELIHGDLKISTDSKGTIIQLSVPLTN